MWDPSLLLVAMPGVGFLARLCLCVSTILSVVLLSVDVEERFS